MTKLLRNYEEYFLLEIEKTKNLEGNHIYNCLSRYCLTKADRFAFGYPMPVSNVLGSAMVFIHPKNEEGENYIQHSTKCPKYFASKKKRIEIPYGYKHGSSKVDSKFLEISTFYPNTIPFHLIGNEDNYHLHLKTSNTSFQVNSNNSFYLTNKNNPFHLTVEEMVLQHKKTFLHLKSRKILCDRLAATHIGKSKKKNVFYEKNHINTESIWRHMSCNEPKICTRCKKYFLSNNNEDICIFHTGKLRRRYKDNPYNNTFYINKTWSCCNGNYDISGCCIYPKHVWNGVVDGINGPLGFFVHTKSLQSNFFSRYNVFALDCQFLYTTAGIEVGMVTVVNMEGRVVYETYVMPDSTVVDFNETFTGLSPHNFLGANVKTLPEVQNDLLSFLGADTILIGHSLNNGLRALKIIHEKIIDTSAIYPHFKGYPCKNSLKVLSQKILKKKFWGTKRNGYENALTTLQLVMKKVLCDYNAQL